MISHSFILRGQTSGLGLGCSCRRGLTVARYGVFWQRTSGSTSLLLARPTLHRGLRHSSRGQGRVLAGSKTDSSKATKVPIKFVIQKKVEYGECVRLVGNRGSLGRWDVNNAPTLQWSDGDVWTADLEVHTDRALEFKFVRVQQGGAEWEGGENRTLQVPQDAGSLTVTAEWNNPELQVSTEQASSSSATSTHTADHPPHHNGNGAVHDSGKDSAAEPSSNGANGAISEDDRPEHLRWAGANPVFMRSNEHSRERDGVWKTEGLQGAALAIVAGDKESASWLKKIGVVKQLLVDATSGERPDLDALSHAYVYLSLIATGAIPCAEGGGHYRPNKHAELARDIFAVLERVAAGGGAGGPGAEAEQIVARKMHPKLPSFTEAFTASVPLTRIRDIAHRSDIPHDLKQQIKHTIQNKLHRNAGPEDLVATETLLAQLSAEPEKYPAAFLAEFRLFTAELRDFFNAGSLADMLQGLRDSLDDSGMQVVNRFLSDKSALDSPAKAADPNALIACLHSLTALRALLAGGLASGLRNDAPDGALAMRQRWRLAELRAEDYAFVLLSRLLGAWEEQGGAEALAKAGDSTWALPIGAAVLGLRQLGLGGWQPGECLALENELAAWQQAGGLQERAAALRLKASLERAQRVTQAYTDLLLGVLPGPATTLGAALGLQDASVQVFTEAEIRASVVFQLSKLCSLLLKATRAVSGAPAWDPLVAGRAVGRLVAVPRLDAGAVAGGGGGPVVLLVEAASGDEEVGSTGANLKGVILQHGLPHLSHLGVRARQEGCVFVACEDPAMIDSAVRPLIGKQVVLTASAEGVTLAEAGAEDAAAGGPSASASSASSAASASPSHNGAGPAPAVSSVIKVSKPELVPLEDASAHSCGAKAAACARLARLAGQAKGADGGTFGTAPGVCLPFGCMEAVLEAAGKKAEFSRLLKQTQTTGPGSALDTACQKLQTLISALRLPAPLLSSLAAEFPADATVIARSSANVEDLAGMSGAGLYDSIPNLEAGDPEALGAGIAGVWASLYTRRAVLSRRAAGVPQAEACMAVLLQQQLAPELSFVLHTASTLERDSGRLEAELAAGLGETLASGTRGSPWRLEVDKASGSVSTASFANFSEALRSRPGQRGAVKVTVDYSRERLSTDEEFRTQMGKQLVAVGSLLEEEFGGPQDVEGAIADGQAYIVQTRPQP